MLAEADLPLADGLAGWLESLRTSRMPPSVLACASLHVLDAVGVGLEVSRMPFGRALTDSLATDPCDRAPALSPRQAAERGITVLGGSQIDDRRIAAVANGGLIHGLEYDDTHIESIMHGSAVVVPSAMAATSARTSTAQFLTGVAAGWEILIRLGLMAPPGSYQRQGFQTAAACGPVAAAATACVLNGHPTDVCRHALAIATSFTGGIMAYAEDGATVKRLHLGWAAHGGVMAADLARRGVTGPAHALEGPQGLSRVLAGASADLSVFDDLGARWHLHDAAFKTYPVCHYLHAYLDCACELQSQVDTREVGSIVCRVHPSVASVVAEPAAPRIHPGDFSAAQYSLQYCVALALLTGRCELEQLLSISTADTRVSRLAARVVVEIAPELEFPGKFGGSVRLLDRDGRLLAERTKDTPNGSALGPANPTPIIDKFRANSATLNEADADRVLSALLQPAEAEASDWLAILGRPKSNRYANS